MYAVFCGVHIVVLIGVFVLFLLCVRNTTSPAKLSFMLICFSLFILIFGMYLEMVDSDTTEAAISALRIQYIGMYPFSLSLLYFTSSMGGFNVPKPMWITFGKLHRHADHRDLQGRKPRAVLFHDENRIRRHLLTH